MTDIVAQYMAPWLIRDVSIVCNLTTAIFLAWAAFAISRGAGGKCPAALSRLLSRWSYGGMAIVLFYNGVLLWEQKDRIPLGSSLLLNIMLLVMTSVSVWRHIVAPDIPENASWKNRMVLKAVVLPAA